MSTPTTDTNIDNLITGANSPAIGDPAEWIRRLLAAVGSASNGASPKRKFQCPVHATTGEHSLSLAVGTRRDGTGAWVHCHAGCDAGQILWALRLTRRDLAVEPDHTPEQHIATHRLTITFPPPKRTPSLAEGGYRFEREHPYAAYDDPRTPVAWKMRYRNRAGDKRIVWESLNDKGERVPGLLGRRQEDLLLYRFVDWRPGMHAGETIYLVESESSVDALMHAGLYATCWPGGAADPPIPQIQALLGHLGDQVVVVPDNDDAGIACAKRLHEALPEARLILGQPGEDARDILGRLGVDGFGEQRHWWSRVDWDAQGSEQEAA